jgi:hypothetical protein
MSLKGEFALRGTISLVIILFNEEALGWSELECFAGLILLITINGFWTLFSAIDKGRRK